ncbi:hypothetical protein Pst134EA_021037 [Puccinia striiformis f. sp. tritici]|uniref:hypothetical protein n=1 Tax=Puccinia striiformis f. sp. tritici TaxID=168172 RepID=UPI002007D3C6|nr:hypothetical protein Pst134EA_021037 [Puccinia striiformis f. sp. tritici]KAH9457144.1 hypothetical protein Pst134EA_021037 [Puccinia striiformis f. sp. tritici]
MVGAPSKSISHPMFVSGPFELLEKLDPVLPQGSSYGQFGYESTVSYFEAECGEEALVGVNVSGYGSAATALNLDSELNLHIGHPDTYPDGFVNKVSVKGLGIVVQRDLVDAPCAANSLQQDLHVLIRHTDYDNLRKDKAVFEVMYIIPGNRQHGKTHGLYQPGREVHLSGYISGFNATRRCWVVQILALSVPSGNQTSISPAKPVRTTSSKKQRIQKVGSMMASAASAPVASTSGRQSRDRPPIVTPSAMASEGRPSYESFSVSNTVDAEDGEVTENGTRDADPEDVFGGSTYPKKRTGPQMLADAQKRMKGK